MLLSLPLAAETTENLCQDPTANREWAERLAAHPNDPLLTHLFAFRQNLCWMTDQGLLTVDQAADLFEKERDKAIEKRQRENMQRRSDPVL
ncbi:MAG: hypothetical protein KDJ34_01505 [Candidatus Competibacteraceae bacterium]|nr:hypothetical protein [Candidatus Competibacteraceae bacterium]